VSEHVYTVRSVGYKTAHIGVLAEPVDRGKAVPGRELCDACSVVWSTASTRTIAPPACSQDIAAKALSMSPGPFAPRILNPEVEYLRGILGVAHLRGVARIGRVVELHDRTA